MPAQVQRGGPQPPRLSDTDATAAPPAAGASELNHPVGARSGTNGTGSGDTP